MSKDRLTKEPRSSTPRPSDGRGIKGEGKDRLSRECRSWNMSRIRGKNTTPEKVVRSLLHRMGYRFRMHVGIPVTAKDANHAKPVGRKTPRRAQKISLFSPTGATQPSPHAMGKGAGGEVLRSRIPRAISVDILLPKHKTAMFVHGCFWHRHRGCVNCTTPTNRREWWLAKLNGNAARDKLHQRALRKLGWHAIVIWECETEGLKSLQRLNSRLARLFRR